MHNPSPLSYQCLQEIQSLAFVNPGIESCGYVFDDGSVTLVENISSTPKETFKIAAKVHHEAIKRGGIAAIWHTHLGMNGLTASDLRASKQLKIPYLVLAIGNMSWSWYDPAYVKPLIGRQWKNPETNCGTLVADYFKQKHGIEFEFIELDETRLNDPNYSPCMDNAERIGFKILPFVLQDLRNDDVIIFKLGTPNPMHVGVMTDISKNQFLHHPINQLSRYEILGGFWLKYAAYIFRWGDWA